MVTRSQVGVGVGASSVGLLAAEGIQQSHERMLMSTRQADLLAAGVSGIPLWAAVFGELGYLPLSGTTSVGLGSFGVGTAGWYAGRRVGIAPRIVVSTPDTVNLAGPLISAFVFTSVGIGVATLVGALR